MGLRERQVNLQLFQCQVDVVEGVEVFHVDLPDLLEFTDELFHLASFARAQPIHPSHPDLGRQDSFLLLHYRWLCRKQLVQLHFDVRRNINIHEVLVLRVVVVEHNPCGGLNENSVLLGKMTPHVLGEIPPKPEGFRHPHQTEVVRLRPVMQLPKLLVVLRVVDVHVLTGQLLQLLRVLSDLVHRKQVPEYPVVVDWDVKIPQYVPGNVQLKLLLVVKPVRNVVNQRVLEDLQHFSDQIIDHVMGLTGSITSLTIP